MRNTHQRGHDPKKNLSWYWDEGPVYPRGKTRASGANEGSLSSGQDPLQPLESGGLLSKPKWRMRDSQKVPKILCAGKNFLSWWAKDSTILFLNVLQMCRYWHHRSIYFGRRAKYRCAIFTFDLNQVYWGQKNVIGFEKNWDSDISEIFRCDSIS